MASNGSAAQRLQALCSEGLALQQTGRLEEARERYKKVLARDPSHFNGLCLMGTVRSEAGQFELAASLTRRAIASVARGVRFGSYASGGAQQPRQRPRQAPAGAKRRWPATTRPWRCSQATARPMPTVAHCSARLGRLDEALAAYDRGRVVGSGGRCLAWLGRGCILQMLARLADALSSEDTGRRRCGPGDLATHLNRGACCWTWSGSTRP